MPKTPTTGALKSKISQLEVFADESLLERFTRPSTFSEQMGMNASVRSPEGKEQEQSREEEKEEQPILSQILVTSQEIQKSLDRIKTLHLLGKSLALENEERERLENRATDLIGISRQLIYIQSRDGGLEGNFAKALDIGLTDKRRKEIDELKGRAEERIRKLEGQIEHFGEVLGREWEERMEREGLFENFELTEEERNEIRGLLLRFGGH